MKRTGMASALLLGLAAGACEDGLLDVNPVDEISDEIAIVDETSARAALIGAYAGLALGEYYSTEFILWPETLSDNVEHTGTFETFADADLLFLRADNFAVQGMWEDIYDAINRANLLIQKVPAIEGFDPEVADEILGQAYGLRALHYFNLVRGWGGVPLVTEPPADLDEAAQVSRSSAAEIYALIAADLAAAETHLTAAGIDNTDRNFITPGFVDALQAKVALYQEDWAGAVAAGMELETSGDYDLAGSFGALFDADGAPTEEDIFRVIFTAVEFNNLGYYYQYDGRFEVGATEEIYNLFAANDERFDVSFDGTRSDGIQVVKFPTTIGGEHPHVIRYAEVLLIIAEGLAQQGGVTNLVDAVAYLNQVRTRAGLAGYVWGVDLTTQQQVLDAINLERRLELAFEGDRWFNLIRTGRAAEALGSNFDAHEALWPIPVSELDVAPNLAQNPGY